MSFYISCNNAILRLLVCKKGTCQRFNKKKSDSNEVLKTLASSGNLFYVGITFLDIELHRGNMGTRFAQICQTLNGHFMLISAY